MSPTAAMRFVWFKVWDIVGAAEMTLKNKRETRTKFVDIIMSFLRVYVRV